MLNRIFRLQARNSSAKVETIAGATTFLTMAYIIFVNPSILSNAGMDKASVVAVTCIVTALATIITGLFANAPIAMAPGMGLNAFFAYTLVITQKISWQTALGVVFLSGLFFMFLTLIGLRKKLVEAIPSSLVSAISVGIGLFITFIGLQNLGIVTDHPVTLVKAANINAAVIIGLSGLIVMIYLEMKKLKGSLLIGIIFSTLLAICLNKYLSPEQKIQVPHTFFSANINIAAVAFKLNIADALKWSLFGSIFSLMFMDMFDSIGTLVACCSEAKMADENGKVKELDRLLAIDAAATMFGALLGTSTTTSYIESAAGIEEGGRTGLTSIVTGILFLAAAFFVPVIGIVPAYATAPALIMVGLFMIKEIKKIDFTHLENAFPAFIIIIMIAFSYNISTGLAYGFISFTLLKVISGNPTQIKPAMWLITILSIFYFLVPLISNK
ncbi:MAG: guanine permease [Planctomycetes bacterium GWF2_41_51]|nr:MAG: guanine permease [Planctomycetes bacterium GWF2_41_51]HBG27554.1 guanine permease [Phycisphaerales bacterium]